MIEEHQLETQLRMGWIMKRNHQLENGWNIKVKNIKLLKIKKIISNFIIKKRSDVIEKSFLKCLEIRFKEENIKKYKELKI